MARPAWAALVFACLGVLGQLAQLDPELAAGRRLASAAAMALLLADFVDAQTGRCIGAEALARWRHPSLGLLLPPGTFIPLAERTGHIIALGNHVLASACRQMAAWARHPGAEGLRLADNVAPASWTTPASPPPWQRCRRRPACRPPS